MNLYSRSLCNVLVCGLSATVLLYSQIAPYQGNRQVQLAALDAQTASIPAGSTATINFVADPSSAGGDTFHIRVDNPSVAITLVLPGGTEVTNANAPGLGYDYVIGTGGDPGKLAPTLLGYSGTEVIITTPAGQVPGTYTVKGNATGITTPSAMIAAYLSSSRVGAGLTSNAPLYRTGDTVLLYAALFDGTSPITAATASADVLEQYLAECPGDHHKLYLDEPETD
jgi:hypothetical protein